MITNAQSSGININKRQLKPLMRRSDRPGIVCTLSWIGLMAVTGTAVMLSMGSGWVVPTLLLHSVILSVPAYALSHECAHGTAFRTRWLNETVFFVTSLLYFEEPLHRRYAHASHHTYTWIKGKDAQMPYADTPLTIGGWVEEILGFGLFWAQGRMFVHHSLGIFSDQVRRVTPKSELPRMQQSTRYCVAAYVGAALVSIVMGWMWVVWLVLLPRLIGGPVMNIFILMQHVEMSENQPNILESTRSFTTNRLVRLLYFNMNYHIEHHLYPNVPFHALPELGKMLADQLPQPDPGILRTNWEVFKVVIRRTFGGDDKSSVIRQGV